MNTEFSSIFYEHKSDIDSLNAHRVGMERVRASHNYPEGKKIRGEKDPANTNSTLTNAGKRFGLSDKETYTASNKKLADNFNNGAASEMKSLDKGLQMRRDKIKSSNECGLMDYDLI